MSNPQVITHKENQVYIIAGLHKEGNVVKLDTGRRYSLEGANVIRDYLNQYCTEERGMLGMTKFVSFNTTAESMLPPYFDY